MSRLTKFMKQSMAAIIGLPLLVVGIILIPLPGPGLVVTFLALLILSWGFDWAHQYVERCKVAFHEIYKKAKERADKIENKYK